MGCWWGLEARGAAACGVGGRASSAAAAATAARPNAAALLLLALRTVVGAPRGERESGIASSERAALPVRSFLCSLPERATRVTPCAPCVNSASVLSLHQASSLFLSPSAVCTERIPALPLFIPCPCCEFRSSPVLWIRGDAGLATSTLDSRSWTIDDQSNGEKVVLP